METRSTYQKRLLNDSVDIYPRIEWDVQSAARALSNQCRHLLQEKNNQANGIRTQGTKNII